MKKVFLSLLFAIFTLAASANQSSILYLKNGSVIKGEILEAVPGGNIKIQTIDGSIFVYPSDEVERIAKNEEATKVKTSTSSTSFSNEYYAPKGLDLYIEAGPDFALGSGGGTTLDAQVEIGKRINKSLFLGVGGGVWAANGATFFPLMGGGRIFMPIENPKILPYLSVRGGYAFGNNGVAAVEVMPGFQYKLSKNADFTFGVGYIGYFGNISSSSIGVRLGFGLHGSTDPVDVNKPKKPSTPTRDKGLQYEIEASGLGMLDEFWDEYGYDKLSSSWGPGFSINYKMNPHLSVGVGGRYHFERNVPIYNPAVNNATYPVRIVFSENEINSGSSVEIFVKGKYRLFGDKRFSPIFRCRSRSLQIYSG